MKTRKNIRTSGFTIVEVMAVLIIIGLLSTLVAVNFLGKIDDAKVQTTKTNLKQLHSAVSSFYMKMGRYPSDEMGLLELIEAPADAENYPPGGFLETTELPKDGWNRDFELIFDYEGKPFAVVSWGADGEEGGEEANTYNKDLYSTDAD